MNKPGCEVDDLKGGVAGGSILKGVLKVCEVLWLAYQIFVVEICIGCIMFNKFCSKSLKLVDFVLFYFESSILVHIGRMDVS